VTALLPRRLVLRLLAAGFGWPPALASAAPLPDRAPPSGFTLVNGTAGGRTLAGTFSGNARSAAVWRSWSLNQQMLRDRMQDAATTMRQTGEILRSAARGQREAFDRASRGFSYYLRGLEVLEQAVKTVTPVLEVKSRRVGGANYQVPVEVPQRRARTLAVGDDGKLLVEPDRLRHESLPRYATRLEVLAASRR